jgi:hypothetical protein
VYPHPPFMLFRRPGSVWRGLDSQVILIGDLWIGKKLNASSIYVALSERCTFNISRGGKYFFTRNQSSIVAFAVGGYVYTLAVKGAWHIIFVFSNVVVISEAMGFPL